MNRTRIKPGPGQESVWDYPRPPRMEDVKGRVEVRFGGVGIADTMRAKRVLETSHPPVYYVPPEDIKDIKDIKDIRMEHLKPADGGSWCEWKGRASYYDVVVGDGVAEKAGWYYTDPTPYFKDLKGYVAFYPSKMDACFVNGERVEAQAGDFYGGWVTANIVGPFKGGPGTWGW